MFFIKENTTDSITAIFNINVSLMNKSCKCNTGGQEAKSKRSIIAFTPGWPVLLRNAQIMKHKEGNYDHEQGLQLL